MHRVLSFESGLPNSCGGYYYFLLVQKLAPLFFFAIIGIGRVKQQLIEMSKQ
jgi:hypothetical protein